MDKELQRAQDMLTVIQRQRDSQANSALYALAELVEARRTIAELENEVARLKGATDGEKTKD